MEIARRAALVLLALFAVVKPQARVQTGAPVDLTALRFLLGE